MECYFGIDGIPGHCGNNSICVIRDDLPAYYYGTTLHQWTVGEHLKAAILAVLITGIITTCLIMGRQQVSRMIAYVRSVIDRWRNKNTTAYESPPFESEEIWREYHKEWWKQVPGVNWVYSRLNRGNSGRFYELNNRGDTVDEPPPYHQN
ncbi:hypothetical protein BDB01DRAFT_718379 [Pilobolus umbonatus]|nr:hypothetical protein BDB01DRAFT_718379 [Pilobolus umbonatus]